MNRFSSLLVSLALAAVTAFALVSLGAVASRAETARTPSCYDDGHGAQVCFPLGDLSFADEIVDFQLGSPPPAKVSDRDPRNVLATPGHAAGSSGRSLTLGCGGSVTVRFSDNAIVDLPGPDLHLFEVGPKEEATRLEISKDGKTWIYVGRVWGGRADIDISWAAEPGSSFHFVRVTDLKYACESKRWPGADLDAIGAIGSATRLSIDSGVLFDVDRADLRPEAAQEIERVAALIRSHAATRVTIEGHTDSDGSEAHNRDLSERRAASVRTALESQGVLGPGMAVEIAGYGESRPVAANDTPSNKQKNRRVDVLVVPGVSPEAAAASDQTLANTRPGVHGEWTRGKHQMTITARPEGAIEATYTSDGGRIFGTVEGQVMNGFWVEDNSKVTCTTERDGSLHWGRLRMRFDPDFVRYKAQWAYCDREEWQGEYSGRWTG